MTSADGARRALITLGAVATTIVLGLLAVARSPATSIPIRTLAASIDAAGMPANGPSSNPALSSGGRILAFDTSATDIVDGDLNGSVRDVVAVDAATGARILVSRAQGNVAANGASRAPALSSDGATVAFVSEASNLVRIDDNGLNDIFVRAHGGPLQLVSVAQDGGPANGVSSQPDISADGRFVTFTSAASNLVPRDDNLRQDVFVRDLEAGSTVLVSDAGDGPSNTPAISGDGRFVSFFSFDRRLVNGDTNRTGDVYVSDLRTGAVERVTVNSRERQQNRSVETPFAQISDLSRDGRYVVFDSDADNLVRGDGNRDTDVFLRDRRRGTTVRLSLSSGGREGDNDSFNPTITANARFIGFESFANNLARGGGPRENVYVRDRRLAATSLISIGARGQAPKRELVRQHLQQPVISEDGQVAVFTSTATNLVERDRNRAEDVFLRILTAPSARRVQIRPAGRRPIVRVSADDPQATRFLCRVDGVPRFECSSGSRLPRRAPGRHTLSVRAGGPGMLYDPRVRKVLFTVPR